MDLYDDLEGPDGTQSTEYDKVDLTAARKKQEDEMELVRQGLANCKQQNAKLLRKCTMLEKNLSCLYKTAWAHLHRKDEYIDALKHQIKEFRKLTGMVAPGVHLDGNPASAPDGRLGDAPEQADRKCDSRAPSAQTLTEPSNTSHGLACRRQRLEQDDKHAANLRSDDQSKRPRSNHDATQKMIANPESGLPDANNPGMKVDNGRGMEPSAARQQHHGATDHCAPAHPKRIRAQHVREHRPPADSPPVAAECGTRDTRECSEHRRSDATQNQRAKPSSGPGDSHHFRMSSHQRDGSYASAWRSGRGSPSMSAPAERGHQRAQRRPSHPDKRSAESLRAPAETSISGDLRQKTGRSYRSSRGSSRHRD